MTQYEVVVLYDPGLEIDLEKGTDKVSKIFKDNDAKVTKVDNWGKKKLAYTINKQDHAVYVFYTVEMPAEGISRVEAIFNITDEIIRFLITKVDLKAIAKAEAAKAEQAKKAKERGDAAEEEAGKTDDSED